MKRIEKEIKRLSMKRIVESLPAIARFESLPHKEKRRRLPIFVAPTLISASLIAFLVPISIFYASSAKFNYVERPEILTSMVGALTSSNQEDVAPPPSLNLALRNQDQMALVRYGFDASLCQEKIAVTLSQKGVYQLSFAPKEGKWHTIESEIISMYGGCIIDYDVRQDLKCVRFAMDEKIPCKIDGRYVIAIYYPGEKQLVEELTIPRTAGENCVEYFSINAEEGEGGMLDERVPNPFSRQLFYVGRNLIDEAGKVTLSKVAESYAQVGEVKENTFTARWPGFFSKGKDIFGTIRALAEDSSIDYEAFKNALPPYLDYYRGNDFNSPKPIPFVERVIEDNSALRYKSAGLILTREKYDDILGAQRLEFGPQEYDASFFEKQALILASFPVWDDGVYYDFHVESIELLQGIIQFKATIELDKSRTGGARMVLAEISKEDIELREEDYVSLFTRVAE